VKKSRSAVSLPNPVGIHLGPSDLVRYGRTFMHPEVAQQWAAAGIGPFDAELFVSAGVDLAAAYEITSKGVRALDWVGNSQFSSLGSREDGAVGHLKITAEATLLWWDEVCEHLRVDFSGIVVQLSDIAEMCGVSLSAVSSWRKTDPEFPSPVVASRSPRFTLASVIEVNSGPLRQADLTPSSLARMVMRTLSERVAVSDQRSGGSEWNTLRRQVADLLASCGRIETDPDLRRAISHLISDRGRRAIDRLVELRKVLVDADPTTIVDEEDPLWRALRWAVVGWMAGIGSTGPVAAGEVLDLLLMTVDEIAPAEEAATGPALAGVMIGLAGIGWGNVVLDPACGSGELLVAASVRAGRGDAGGRYIGCDLDADAVRVAEVRLRLRFLAPLIHRLDWLAVTDAKSLGIDSVDTILIDPPLDQPVGEWVRSSLPILSERGRLVIVARASDIGPETAIGELAADGHVEAEIKIPQRARGEGRLAKYVVVTAKESFIGQLPVRDDLSYQRITIAGGRVRTGVGSGTTSDRIGLDYSAALRALTARRSQVRTHHRRGREFGGLVQFLDASVGDSSIYEASAVELAEQLLSRLENQSGIDSESKIHLSLKVLLRDFCQSHR